MTQSPNFNLLPLLVQTFADVCNMGVLLRPSALLPVLAALLLHASAQVTVKCPRSSSPQRVSNYGGVVLKLDLTPTDNTVLQPNMDCAFFVVGVATSKWVITLDTVSLEAYQAEFVIEDNGKGGRQILAIDSNHGTPYRQVVTTMGLFYVRLTTKTGPTASALGVKLLVQQVGPRDCPIDWYSPASNRGYCYGVPKPDARLTFDDAIKGCNLMQANLAMGDSGYDSIVQYLLAAPPSVLNSKRSYWVGLYYYDGEVMYLNKYKTLDTIADDSLCSSSSSSCNCVAYQKGKFYRDDCNRRRRYVCYMSRDIT